MEDTRVNRLRQWLDEFDGKVATFVRYYKLPRSRASYISQLLSGTRPLGERAARKLEEECGRPAGWLDVVPDAGAPAEIIHFDRARCAKLPAEDRKLIEDFIALVLAKHDSRGKLRFNEVTVKSGSPDRLKVAARRPLKNSLTKTGTNASQAVHKRHKAG